MAKVDVIIPTHNRAEFVRSAIASVLNQTYRDLEIIVVDDASEDNTREIVHGFADSRVRYIRHEVNTGEAGSRNTGVTNCRGEYIAFLDDDDEWLPQKLELQVELLERSGPHVAGVYTGFLAIENSTGRLAWQRRPTKRGNIYKDMIFENTVGTSSTVLLRGDVFKKVGLFDETILWGLDYDMWIRMSREFHFECIETPLVKYRIHAEQITNNLEVQIQGTEMMLQKYKDLFGSDRRAYSGRHSELGFLCRENGMLWKAWKTAVKAAKLDPFSMKKHIDLAKITWISLVGARRYAGLRAIKDGLISKSRHSPAGRNEK